MELLMSQPLWEQKSEMQWSPQPKAWCNRPKQVHSPSPAAIESKARSQKPSPQLEARLNRVRSPKPGVIESEFWERDLHYRATVSPAQQLYLSSQSFTSC